MAHSLLKQQIRENIENFNFWAISGRTFVLQYTKFHKSLNHWLFFIKVQCFLKLEILHWHKKILYFNSCFVLNFKCLAAITIYNIRFTSWRFFTTKHPNWTGIKLLFSIIVKEKSTKWANTEKKQCSLNHLLKTQKKEQREIFCFTRMVINFVLHSCLSII